MNKTIILAALAATLSAGAATAATTTLTFEGLANSTPVGNFYPSQGVVFSPSTLALIDSDAGGTGNFANEPSNDTVMFFLDSNNAVMNVAGGFTTGVSFFFTSSVATSVTVWDGLDGTGALLGTINLTAQFADNCGGDPTGGFCNWSLGGVAFTGTARSVNFASTANQVAFDDITLGSATGAITGAVPEPASWALLIAGFGLTGAAMRRRRAAVAA